MQSSLFFYNLCEKITMSTADQQNKSPERNHATAVSRLETMKTYLAGLMNKADSAKLMHSSPAIIETAL